MEKTNFLKHQKQKFSAWLFLGTSKVASTISSTLIKKRPAATEDTTEAKKMHLDSSTTSSSENGHTKNGN